MGDPSSIQRQHKRPSQSPHHRRPTEAEEMRKALSQSVSFGRFMSESLDWERWSSFTRNRNLEEAEMSSKPGSVALRKAYFEANRRAPPPSVAPLPSPPPPSSSSSSSSSSFKPVAESLRSSGDNNGGKLSCPRRRRSWGKENKAAASTSSIIASSSSSNDHVKRSGGRRIASSSSSSCSRQVYPTSKEEASGEKNGGEVASVSRSGKRSKVKGESPVGGKRTLSSPTQTGANTACMPFRFRCEERVVRRKEFFHKLEENMREREAKKVQENGDNELRRQWMNVVCKHKSVAFLN